MIHFVYETTNLINNKKYIGKHSTTNIDDGYLGSGIVLKQAINKYGRKNFKRKILVIVDSEEEAYEYEQKLITKKIIESNDYYNIMLGGEGCGSGKNHPMYGKQMSEESKKKISNSLKGKNHPMYGKHFSDEHNNKISESQRGENGNMWGKKASKETKQKMSKAHKGKQISEETKIKISKSRKGKYIGENHYKSKLTEKQVIDIRKRLQQGETIKVLLKYYNVSKNTITCIKYNRTWKHITI
jgi:group I intron endonuclease